MNRRDFLRASSAAALGFGVADEAQAQATQAPATQAQATTAASAQWDAGTLRHLLPQVSDSRMLIKASFTTPLAEAPVLRVGEAAVLGRMGDTRGEHWHFYATDLEPGRRYALSLADSRGRALAQPWEIATFPGPDERPQRFRVLF